MKRRWKLTEMKLNKLKEFSKWLFGNLMPLNVITDQPIITSLLWALDCRKLKI